MVCCWGPAARNFIHGTLTSNQEFLMYLIHGTTRVYIMSLLHTSRKIFHIGLQPGTSMRSVRIDVVITLDHLMFLQTYFNRWNESLDIEDLLGLFLSNIKGATLSEAFLMHQEGFNLDEQYLLHLDLTIEYTMVDVAGVDLPLYIESALSIARSKNAACLNSSRHYAGNNLRACSQALDVPQLVQPTIPRDTCQPFDFPSSAVGTSTLTASHPQLSIAFEQDILTKAHIVPLLPALQLHQLLQLSQLHLPVQVPIPSHLPHEVTSGLVWVS
ncbi:hypothetical protein SELMODRAFT_421845 [Selaginella moellendorffii]|uniref:Uncharacterized protein n=1 Tax=Selaginella moellendorffii TaxID=88036 RepID=D8SGJ3_SELML|nr:hypothetical protein SELMODRAFT_421845 [Selaginella moellendorffii]